MPDPSRAKAVARKIQYDLDEAVHLENMAASLRARAAVKANAWDLTIDGNKVLTTDTESESM